MSSTGATRLFLLGILVFFCARAYLILAPSAALQVPRLGDDSLVYLWKAQSAFVQDVATLPALRDIKMQRFLDDAPSPELRWERSNAAQRTLGQVTPTYNLPTAAFRAVVGDLRWTFACSEMMILLVMTLGLAWFARELTGPAEAGLAMLLMAFAILPNQGIYAFIPGTFALSCGLVLWAYVLRKGLCSSWWLVALLSAWISGLHPIGKMYVAIAPFLLLLRDGEVRSFAFWRIVTACGVGAGGIALLPVVFPSMAPPPSEIMGGIGQIEYLVNNLRIVGRWLYDPIIRKNPAWAVLFVCGIVFAPKSTLAGPMGRFAAGVLLLLLGSMLHWLPGYPAELFSRIWVLFVLAGALVGARFILHLYNGRERLRKLIVVSCFAAFLGSTVYWAVNYVPMTMNWRNEILYEDLFARQLDALQPAATIMYADSINSLQASLLLGGGRFGALVYPMLKGSPHLERLMAERHPAAIVVPGATSSLNSLAQTGKKLPLKRRYGLSMKEVGRFHLSRNHGSGFSRTQFLFDAGRPGDCLKLRLVGAAKGAGEERVICPETGRSWYDIGADDSVEEVVVEAPKSDVWLLGIRKDSAGDHVLWPWETGWKLTYSPKRKQKKTISVDFSVKSVLEKSDAGELEKFVASDHPVISDDSGMVFLAVRDGRAVDSAVPAGKPSR